VVQSQLGQIVPQDPIPKNLSEERAGREFQGEIPEFKSQHCKKKKRE
jgi:hypothetical protein